MQSGNPTHDALDPAERPLFTAILRPYRSLGWSGFIALMAAVAALNIAGAIVFFVAGAWPVLPFLGLDVLVVWLAFRANYLAARAYEEVIVTPLEIIVRRVDRRGRSAEWRFNPAWTRLTETRDSDGELIVGLTLDEGRRKLDIAGLVPPVERVGFAKALRVALADAKLGVGLR